jgi:hypothetical protein
MPLTAMPDRLKRIDVGRLHKGSRRGRSDPDCGSSRLLGLR